MIAGIETGGTKVICAVATEDDPHTLVDVTEMPTTTPAEVGLKIRAFLDRWQAADRMAVGVASFGPLDLDRHSPTFESITATTKPGWSGTSLRPLIGDGRDIILVSDVTGAAIGEGELGAARGLDAAAYVTVGTGVGVGAVVGGRPMSASTHPEMGHISVRRHPDDSFDGVCPFHGACIEGLASGPAMAQRWGKPTQDLGDALGDALELEAYYLGQLLATVSYALVPQRVILGGGVLKIPGMLDAARSATRREINGALGPSHPTGATNYIEAPALGDFSGVHGALHLAATHTLTPAS